MKKWCAKYDIPMLEISYLDTEIEKTLTNFIENIQ